MKMIKDKNLMAVVDSGVIFWYHSINKEGNPSNNLDWYLCGSGVILDTTIQTQIDNGYLEY